MKWNWYYHPIKFWFIWSMLIFWYFVLHKFNEKKWEKNILSTKLRRFDLVSKYCFLYYKGKKQPGLSLENLKVTSQLQLWVSIHSPSIFVRYFWKKLFHLGMEQDTKPSFTNPKVNFHLQCRLQNHICQKQPLFNFLCTLLAI